MNCNTKGYSKKTKILLNIYKFSLTTLAICFAFEVNIAFCQEQTPDSTNQHIRIGILSKRGHDQCLQQWTATADYLSKNIPEYTFSIKPLGFSKLKATIINNEVEFFFTNPSYYVDLEKRSGARRIATLKNNQWDKKHHTRYAGTIFCKRDRADIQNISDLKNIKFMAVDKHSLGGWHMAWRILLEHNIDPHKDFLELSFGGTHDAVVYAVRDGIIDAGTVRSDTLERMSQENKIKLTDFKVLNPHHRDDCEIPFMHSTRHYPEWPFAKSCHTPDSLAELVASALIQMPKDCLAATKAKCNGWTIPHNYQPVHECLKIIKFSPYEQYGKVLPRDFFYQYRVWITAVFSMIIAVFILFFYIIRMRIRLKQAVLIKIERDKLTAIFESMKDGVFISNENHEIQYTNYALVKTFGIGVGKKCYEYLRNADTPCKSCQKWDDFLIKPSDKKSTFLINGKTYDIIYTILKNPDGTISKLGLLRDITRLVKLNEEHEDAVANLYQAQKMEAIGQLASGVAHDFNNILQAVNGYIELALAESDKKSTAYKFTKQAMKETTRARLLTRQLLTLSRKSSCEDKNIDLNILIENLLNMLSLIINKQIKLLYTPAKQPLFIHADSGRIEQIIMNLCINARDAMINGGKLTITTEKRILDNAFCKINTWAKQGDYAVIIITDNGCGMNEQTQQKIFKPFFTTKDISKGTGLGLSIVFDIVNKYNGLIHVDSKTRHGSTFEIYLPCQK